MIVTEMTDPQKNLLQTLLQNDVWLSILADVEKNYDIPEWQPSERKRKKSRWIHDSGKKSAATEIVTFLRLNQE